MRAAIRVPSLAALLVGLAAALACGGGGEPRSYAVKGQVVRVVDGGRSLVVAHEDVPGFMDAMQMTLPVQDAAMAKGLSPGDKIRFDLLVADDGAALIGAIAALPDDAALELAPAQR